MILRYMGVLSTLFVIPFYFAQAPDNGEVVATEAEYRQCENFRKTEPLRDMPAIETPSSKTHREGNAWERRPRATHDNPNSLPIGMDPVAQLEMGTKVSTKAAEPNFNGSGGAMPPDPTGAAGAEYYVQAVNTSFKIYRKSDGGGASISYPLNYLWPGSSNDGDPIVMYDRYAERWVITQFQTSSNKILFAVSETEDPLGSYFTYEYSFNSFPDYPKYSVWSDGYYMTANSGSQNVVVFDREKMLAGDPTAGRIALNFPSGVSYFFRSVLPADADGGLPPYGTPNYLFHIQDDGWSGVSYDHIIVFKFQTDWATPSNSSVTISQRIATQPFNAVFTQSWNDIPQPGTSQRIDAIAGVLNYRAQYMRWVNHNTMMLCHVVDVNNASNISNKRAGVRWYELRQYGNDAEWEIYQQGTYAPAGTDHRWLGSIAMDANGHIAMAYSISGPNRFPSIGYTGRYDWDVPGVMTRAELIAVEGGSAQTEGERFGDYSQMTLDPVDPTRFWYTGEYIGPSGARRTRIFSFRIDDIVGVNENILSKLEWVIKTNENTIDVLVKGVPDNQDIHLDLFDASGREIEISILKSQQGEIGKVIATNSLAKGTYLIRIGNDSFQDVKKVVVN
jgi:hypothetical protein